jgi:hypothetical protein
MEPGGFIPLMFMNSAIGCGEFWHWSLIRPAVESSSLDSSTEQDSPDEHVGV